LKARSPLGVAGFFLWVLINKRPTSKKADTPAHRQAETDRQAKKIKHECRTIKKTKQEVTQSLYKLETQANSWFLAMHRIKRLKSALKGKLEGIPESRHQGHHHVKVILML
jgi:hypothetical protein